MTLLSLGVIGTSAKENEHRLPIHPEHLSRLSPEIAARTTLEHGYAAHFGVSDADLATLTDLVESESGRMLSPSVGLSSPISLQSWNHQLSVDSASDPRVQQYADFFTFGSDADGTSLYPEVGATCENPAFVSDPVLQGGTSRSAAGAVPTDVASTPTAAGAPAAPTTAG